MDLTYLFNSFGGFFTRICGWYFTAFGVTVDVRSILLYSALVLILFTFVRRIF